MKAKLLEIFEINYKMSALSRFSQTHLINEESVLEHTGFVCSMCYYIGTKLNEKGNSLDIGVLMCKAVVHDVDEIVTGDIPRPTKYYNEGVRDALQEIEHTNMQRIALEISSPRIYQDWSNAKEGREGSIVALADCLAIVFKVHYEVVMFGNKTIISHCSSTIDNLDGIAKEMREHFGEDDFLHSIVNDAKIIIENIVKLEK